MSAYDDLDAGAYSPSELIPGDLAAVEKLAGACEGFATQLARTRQAVTYIQLHGSSWTGRAADVYEAARTAHLGKLATAATAYDVAARALAYYALALIDARHRAGDAQKDFIRAKHAAARCRTANAGVIGSIAIPVTTTGAAAELEQARADVAAAGRDAAKALDAASATSPTPLAPDQHESFGDKLAGLVTSPYHLLHGYVGNILGSFEGLGLSQYAGTHGLPLPGTSADLQAAQREMLGSAGGTLDLLLIPDGTAGLLLALRGGAEGVEGAEAVGALMRSLPKGSAKIIRTVRTERDLRALHELLVQGSRRFERPGATYHGFWVRRRDGIEIGLRESQKSGLTIDINIPETRETWKVHVNERS
ncbi:putative T7SS-secreted protein [Nocardioides montaniterrae]